MDPQTDLSLCWAHTHFVGFVMSLLICLILLSDTASSQGQEEKQKESKFCVWITSEPCPRIPDYLLLNLHKLAWNHVTMDVLQQDALAEQETSTDGGEAPLAVNYRSPQTYLHAGMYYKNPKNFQYQKNLL